MASGGETTTIHVSSLFRPSSPFADTRTVKAAASAFSLGRGSGLAVCHPPVKLVSAGVSSPVTRVEAEAARMAIFAR